MTSSKMYKLVNQFNEKEPKEIELIYRPWEKPEDRIFIEPADFAANKFMVEKKVYIVERFMLLVLPTSKFLKLL